MKIRVIFHDEKISWDKKWIFLGSSYKNLKTAEKKISGPRFYSRAKKIIVMNQGKIVDIGTHNELLKNSIIYKNLYSKQLSA